MEHPFKGLLSSGQTVVLSNHSINQTNSSSTTTSAAHWSKSPNTYICLHAYGID
jgi:hypothetical protein